MTSFACVNRSTRLVSLPPGAIGLVASAVSGRLIERMLFGVRPLDLATFAFVTIVVGFRRDGDRGPAWRAVRIDPASALRNT